jgi:hypothetical protein
MARVEGSAMHYSRISADCHIDMPWLPADLFTANASAAMKERMLYVVDGPDGPCWTTRKGAAMGLVGGVGSTGSKYVPGQNYRLDVMASTGLYDDGKKGIRRPADPHLRRADMERDGVDAEVLFGILGAATRFGDHEAAAEMFRIYNDRMDFEWEDRFRDLGLTMKPSDYWRRQCKATFQFDRIGTKLIDDMGAETLMWGSDYPHPDGVWPESSKYIEEQFGHLPPDVVRKITCENAGKFYGLIR